MDRLSFISLSLSEAGGTVVNASRHLPGAFCHHRHRHHRLETLRKLKPVERAPGGGGVRQPSPARAQGPKMCVGELRGSNPRRPTHHSRGAEHHADCAACRPSPARARGPCPSPTATARRSLPPAPIHSLSRARPSQAVGTHARQCTSTHTRTRKHAQACTDTHTHAKARMHAHARTHQHARTFTSHTRAHARAHKLARKSW